jgi:hypothetical protein
MTARSRGRRPERRLPGAVLLDAPDDERARRGSRVSDGKRAANTLDERAFGLAFAEVERRQGLPFGDLLARLLRECDPHARVDVLVGAGTPGVADGEAEGRSMR